MDALRAFGMALGRAFQAVDDWLGLWGDPARTGKPAASDLRQRKCSLPIVAALGSGTEEARALRGWMGSQEPADEASVARALAWVESTGAADATRRVAAEELARAEGALAGARIEPEARAELLALARFTVERDL